MRCKAGQECRASEDTRPGRGCGVSQAPPTTPAGWRGTCGSPCIQASMPVLPAEERVAPPVPAGEEEGPEPPPSPVPAQSC